MTTTPLTKKERGKLRYDRHQAGVTQQRAKKGRTRTSDIAPKRITDGVSGKIEKHIFTPPAPTKKTRSMLEAMQNMILANGSVTAMPTK